MPDRLQWDNSSIETFWGCVPTPEQRALKFMAQFVNTPNPIVGVSVVKAYMLPFVPLNVEKRLQILLSTPYIVTTPETPLICEDEAGCVLVDVSPWLLEIATGELLGKFQIGAPVDPPCYFAPVMP